VRTGRLARGDRVALAVLVGIPVLVFSVPAAFGYPLLTGDAVIQNYPLRALAGEILRHGHLPVYNPFAWGGTPLLASANAGAIFPDTVFFALLPALAAWVATEVAAFGAAAVGLYVFLRLDGLRPLSAALGGAAFAFGGFVTSQAVHLDVVETAAALAWVLVAIERVARGPDRHRLAWTALLAVAAAATALAGSPEVAFYAAVAAAIYAGARLVHAARRLVTAALFVVAGGAGALVSAVLVLPAARFVDVSQRADVTLSYLVAGGLRAAQLPLLLVPHILGGGPIGLSTYVGNYNLGEIDAYPGVLALVAVVALAFRWRSPAATRIRVWYLIGATGFVIALGSSTPIPRLLHFLPVIGASRLPSRALLLVALACSVLLAYWSAEVLDPGSTLPPRRPPGATRPAGRFERLAPLAFPGAILVTIAVVAVGGSRVARALAGQPIGPWSLPRVAPYLAVTAAIALAASWFVVAGGRLARRRRAGLLVALAIVDLVVFSANQSSLAPVRAAALGQPNRLERALARAIGPDGRFIVVDPARASGLQLNEIGAPNLNAFFGIASAQGYGSLTWAAYAEATGTHGQDVVAPAALASRLFDSLDVRALLVLAPSFESPVARHHPRLVTLDSSGPTTRYFGSTVRVASIKIATTHAVPVGVLASLARQIRLVAAPATETPARVFIGDERATVTFPPGARGSGIVLPRAPGGPAQLAVTVSPVGAAPFSPTGPLAAVVTPPHWRLAGSIGPYVWLADTRAFGPFATLSATGTGRVTAHVRVVATSPWTASESVEVDAARACLLVRSVAHIPGWQATITSRGRARPAVVRRFGLVQAVELPAGVSFVTFRYDPPGLAPGVLLAACGAALIAALLLVGIVRSRRPPG
jgi:hypothetical protein